MAPFEMVDVNLPTERGGRPYGASRSPDDHARWLRKRMYQRGDAFTAAWNAAGYERMRTARHAQSAIDWARLSPDVVPAVRRAANELSKAITAYQRAGKRAGAR